MIELENKKIYDFIVQKDLLVDEGRKISREMEAMDVKIKRFEEKEKRITSKVKLPPDLEKRGDAIVKEIEALDREMSKLLKKINDAKLEAIPKDMKEQHVQLLKEREIKERDRNKIALKVQKLKDKVVPVIQKDVKPLLGEYEDIETAKVKDGKIVITTFSHLEEWKSKFKR